MLNWDGNLIYQLLIKTKDKTILIKYEQCEISPYFRSELIKHPLVVKCSKGVHQLNITSLYSISNLLLFPRIPLNHFISCWGGFIMLLQHLHRLAAALVGAWHRDALSWSSLRMNPYFDYKETGIIVWHFQIFNYASVHWSCKSWDWSSCSFCVSSLSFSFPATCGSGSCTLDSNCHFPWFEIPAVGPSL